VLEIIRRRRSLASALRYIRAKPLHLPALPTAIQHKSGSAKRQRNVPAHVLQRIQEHTGIVLVRIDAYSAATMSNAQAG